MKNVSTQEVPTVSHRRHSQSQKGYFKGIEWEKKNNIYFLDKQIWILQACVSHEHFANMGNAIYLMNCGLSPFTKQQSVPNTGSNNDTIYPADRHLINQN